MNKAQFLKLIIIALILYSCKSDLEDYKNFQFAEYNMKIKIPKDFVSASEEDIKKFYKSGSINLAEYGQKTDSIQSNILFLNKGEFSSIIIKYTHIDKEVMRDYENQWRILNKSTFDILNKAKLSEYKLDSTSRIEKINNIDFYVFETNVKLLDLNKNKANFKTLRYSTPLNELDYVINVDYVNKLDEEIILKSINSLIIEKK